MTRNGLSYLVEVVLLVKLALNLALDGQAQKERILLASGRRRVDVALPEHTLECLHSLAGGIHLLLNRVLKVAGQVLDLLDLLLQVASEPGQCKNDVFLNLLCLVRFKNSIFVVASQDL